MQSIYQSALLLFSHLDLTENTHKKFSIDDYDLLQEQMLGFMDDNEQDTLDSYIAVLELIKFLWQRKIVKNKNIKQAEMMTLFSWLYLRRTAQLKPRLLEKNNSFNKFSRA